MYQPEFPPVPFRLGLYPVVDSVQWIERLYSPGAQHAVPAVPAPAVRKASVWFVSETHVPARYKKDVPPARRRFPYHHVSKRPVADLPRGWR